MADPTLPLPTEAELEAIAHDMRNALATLKMNVALLKRAATAGDGGRVDKHVELIGRAADRMQSLVVRLRPDPDVPTP